MTDPVSRTENRPRRAYTRKAAHPVPKECAGDTGGPYYTRSELMRMDYRFAQRLASAGYMRREEK